MLSAIILARNEEEHIKKTIDSVSFCDEIVVIDDESEDKTKELSERLGAKVYTRSHLDDFSRARNDSMEKAKGDWLFFVDADEIVPAALAKEIKNVIKDEESDIVGYYVKRVDFWWGKEIYHGEAGNTKILRLIKNGQGRWQGKVHETLETIGETKTLHYQLHHYPHTTIASFLEHINQYSSMRAQELYDKKVKTNTFEIMMYPFAKFMLNYFFRLGFLDGPPGFVYAFMMSFHSFLVRGKLYQLQDHKK